MNQSKFSLADLLTVLAAAGFGFFCFLSCNFLLLGETAPSIIIAAVFAIILGGLAFGAKLLKKTSRNFKTCIIGEWVLLFLFAVVAVFAVILFSHYFVVSEQKTEIQQKVNDCIAQSEGMFDDYRTYAETRIGIYKKELENAISKGDNGRYIYPGKYRQFQFQAGGDDNRQLSDKIGDLRNGLFTYPHDYHSFQDEKERDAAWLAEAKQTVASWSPISVVDVVSNVRSNLAQWHNNLNEMSKFRPKGKDGNIIENAKDFDEVYPQTLCADDMTEYFTGEYAQDLTSTAALCRAAGLYALMLLSYCITKRSSKNHYTLYGKKKSQDTNNNVDITKFFE